MDIDNIIKKIKNGSKFSAIVCALAAAGNVIATLGFLFTPIYVGQGQSAVVHEFIGLQGCVTLKNLITYAVCALIMLIAAVMFFRIAKTGKPFTRTMTKLTRLIGILFVANAIVPGLIGCALSNYHIDGADGFLVLLNPTSLIEGLLFLFIAYVIHYGALLQQESDETL